MTDSQKADYNSSSWSVFNYFAFVFMMVPYPTMMLACGYFIFTDGIFSYAGYCAIETIAVSTLIVCLLFIDSISVVQCCQCAKRKRVRDYESDREPKSRKEFMEFGDMGTDLNGS